MKISLEFVDGDDVLEFYEEGFVQRNMRGDELLYDVEFDNGSVREDIEEIYY